jgi:hypothetical protein
VPGAATSSTRPRPVCSATEDTVQDGCNTARGHQSPVRTAVAQTTSWYSIQYCTAATAALPAPVPHSRARAIARATCSSNYKPCFITQLMSRRQTRTKAALAVVQWQTAKHACTAATREGCAGQPPPCRQLRRASDPEGDNSTENDHPHSSVFRKSETVQYIRLATAHTHRTLNSNVARAMHIQSRQFAAQVISTSPLPAAATRSPRGQRRSYDYRAFRYDTAATTRGHRRRPPPSSTTNAHACRQRARNSQG